MRGLLMAAAAVAASGVGVRADNLVVPLSSATTAGGTGLNTVARDLPRTYQMVIGASRLSEIPAGSWITGMTFRQDDGTAAAWPPAAQVWTSYEVRLSACPNAPGAISTTFASNIGPDVVTVRSGGLTIPVNSFPGSAGVPGFGSTIDFPTPYKYAGTDLAITIVHTGSGGTPTFMDAIPSGTVAGIDAISAADAVSATGAAAAFTITRLTYVTPEGVSKSYAPAVNGGVSGSSLGGQSTLVFTSARTHQTVISASELSYLKPGSVLKGVTFRVGNGGLTAFPSADASFVNYQIQLAPAATTPATMSNTYAANIGAGAVTVRSGALNIAAGSFPSTGVAFPDRNPFGRAIEFDTPYVYTGGDLVMTVQHTGIVGAGAQFMDSLLSTDPAYGVKIKAIGGAPAATGSPLSATILRFTTSPGVVGPNALAQAPGTLTQAAQTQSSAFTVQLVIGASELSAIPLGSTIDGVAWRRTSDGGAAWPAGGDAYFTQYDITVSKSLNPPGSLSTTVAANIGTDAVVVRQGPLVVPAGAAPGSATSPATNPFGFVIRFDKKYVYTGGDLLLTINKGTSNRTFGTLDASTPGLAGAAVQQRQASGSATSATVGTNANVPTTLVIYTPSETAPNQFAYVQPDNGGNSGHIFDTGATVQTVYAASQLSHIPPGSHINGIAWRVSHFGGQPAWPTDDATFSQYDVQVSGSVNAPGSMSTTFASNIASDVVLVRSGPMTIPTGAFPGGAVAPAVNQFGGYIQFNKPYVYNGGNLLVTVRQSGAGSALGTRFLDGIFPGDPGYGVLGQCMQTTGNPGATTGSQARLITARFAFTPPAGVACYANCDGSTVPPILNVNDFICFQTRFAANDPYANCDGSAVPPVLNVNDFICFQTKFAQGCP